jgi:hypothetical protein
MSRKLKPFDAAKYRANRKVIAAYVTEALESGDAPKCIVCGQRHWSRQDAICRFLERPLFSCAFQRYRLLQQIAKRKYPQHPASF